MNQIELIEHFQEVAGAPDAISRLRRFILNLAVRGKLVPQDQNDEPASELLERARNAKIQFMTERNINRDSPPELSISAAETSCPKHWEWAYIYDIALVLGGKRLPEGASFSSEDTGHIYIRVTDMKDGTISSEAVKFISNEVKQKIAKYIIESNDLTSFTNKISPKTQQRLSFERSTNGSCFYRFDRVMLRNSFEIKRSKWLSQSWH
jgi:type I restriction enzyme S subunit